MIIVKIMGGLGNQLFQYATARNISINEMVPLKVDTTFYDDSRYKGIFRLNHYDTVIEKAKEEEIKSLTAETSASLYARMCRRFHISGKFYKKTHIIENNAIIIDKRIVSCNGNAYIEGWYQNEAYFSEIRDVLIKEFSLKNYSNTEFQNTLYKINNSESVSIHFRRGDNLTNKFFGAVPIDYYYEAVNFIKSNVKNPVFYLFSDDPAWVKSSFRIDGEVVYVNTMTKKASVYHTENDFEDLDLMKHCKHNVIANSTFSWWAAWLNANPDKIIIAPVRWYNDNQAQKCYEKGRLRVSGWVYI